VVFSAQRTSFVPSAGASSTSIAPSSDTAGAAAAGSSTSIPSAVAAAALARERQRQFRQTAGLQDFPDVQIKWRETPWKGRERRLRMQTCRHADMHSQINIVTRADGRRTFLGYAVVQCRSVISFRASERASGENHHRRYHTARCMDGVPDVVSDRSNPAPQMRRHATRARAQYVHGGPLDKSAVVQTIHMK
jgi:hypothetical protein